MKLPAGIRVAWLAFLLIPSCGKKASPPAPGAGEGKAVPVAVSPAKVAEVARRIQVRCLLRSRRRALVAPKVPGVLQKLRVDTGDRVKGGVTVLFETDSRIPSDALKAARAGLEAAGKALGEARAALGAARAAEAKARRDRDRFRRLFQEGKAVTKDALEKAQVAWEGAAADLERAGAAVGLARAREEQARVQADIAEKRLRDCTVLAPMDGVVTRKFMEQGEMGDPGRPVFALEDPDHLEAAGFLRASLFPLLEPGKTLVRILRGGREIYRAPLSWKAPSIRPELRVFEARLYLPGGFHRVPSGELLTMEVVLEPHRALVVPTAAVTLRGRKPTVFAVREGKARLVVLQTGVVDGEKTEVLGGGLKEGERVVVRGQAFLEEGRAVRIVPAGRGG